MKWSKEAEQAVSKITFLACKISSNSYLISLKNDPLKTSPKQSLVKKRSGKNGVLAKLFNDGVKGLVEFLFLVDV